MADNESHDEQLKRDVMQSFAGVLNYVESSAPVRAGKRRADDTMTASVRYLHDHRAVELGTIKNLMFDGTQSADHVISVLLRFREAALMTDDEAFGDHLDYVVCFCLRAFGACTASSLCPSHPHHII